MTLETEVASLTTATTALLTAVNASKATLDAAKDSATASSSSATASASTATTKAGEASASATLAGNYATAAGNSATAAQGYAATAQTISISGIINGTAAAPSLAAAADPNTGVFWPAADTVAISTGGTERVRVDASGNVVVGASSVIGAGKVSAQTDLSTLNGYVLRDTATTYGNTNNFFLVQNSAGTSIGSLSHPAANSIGLWGYDDIRFLQGSAGTEKMRLDASGNLQHSSGTAALPSLTFLGDTNTGIYRPGEDQVAISTGGTAQVSVGSTGLVTLTAGQIKFPATQNASADANTLDDYEEGTWTPTLTFQTPGDVSVSYVGQSGFYTKVGNRVVLSCWIVTSAFTHSTSAGYLKIEGIPFASANIANAQDYGALQFGGITKAGYSNFSASVERGTSMIIVYCSGSGQNPAFVSASDMPSGGVVTIKFTICYQAA